MVELLLQNYRPAGGIHPETATVANVLTHLGVLAPHTGKPFTEELCLGLGGGIGFEVRLHQGRGWPGPRFAVGVRRAASEPKVFVEAMMRRLAVPHRFFETTGPKKAESQLIDTLAAERPAIVWVDPHRLPYSFVPESLPASPYPWSVVVYGIDARSVLVDDLSKKPFLLSREQLRRARQRPASLRHLLLDVRRASPGRPEARYLEALCDTIASLYDRRPGRGLRAMEAFAASIDDEKSRRGWPQLFPDGRGLFGALLHLHESLGHLGTDGVGLRAMFADYLAEMGRILGNREFARLSRRYRAVSKLWSRFVELLLPQEQFGEVSMLVEKKHVVLRTQGQSGLDELAHFCGRLDEMRRRYDTDCPLDAKERAELLGSLAAAMREIHAQEREMAAQLEQLHAEAGAA